MGTPKTFHNYRVNNLPGNSEFQPRNRLAYFVRKLIVAYLSTGKPIVQDKRSVIANVY